MARAILSPAFIFDRQETDEFEFVAANKLMCVLISHLFVSILMVFRSQANRILGNF